MREPEDIYYQMKDEMPWQLIGEDQIKPYIEEAIKIAQKEAWNEATLKAAEDAELGTRSIHSDTVYVIGKETQVNAVDIICVNKESILKNLIK